MSSDEGIAAFMNARLDEDEAAAMEAASVAGPAWQFGRDFPTSYLRSVSGGILADMLLSDDGQIGPHLARHDPARVLREVKADRKLVLRHEEDRHQAGQCSNCFDAFGQHPAWPCPTIRIVASIYSDHPDYRQAWKP